MFDSRWQQDNDIPFNVHHFCTQGVQCSTMGISTEYRYSHDINLAFKRLYAKGYKHWHRLQNLAASLSPPFVLQLCGISSLSCSNLLPSSEIMVYVSMGYKASIHTAQHKHKKHTLTYIHTYIHTYMKSVLKEFWGLLNRTHYIPHIFH
jgi:hypothetical protein